MEISQDYEPRTLLQVVWDAVRNMFVQVAYAIIDGIAVFLKELLYDLAYR